MFSPSSDIRIGWSTSTFKTPLLWEIFLNIPFNKISHGFAMYDWSVNTSLSNPNPIRNPRTVIPEELYLYNHRMSFGCCLRSHKFGKMCSSRFCYSIGRYLSVGLKWSSVWLEYCNIADFSWISLDWIRSSLTHLAYL